MKKKGKTSKSGDPNLGCMKLFAAGCMKLFAALLVATTLTLAQTAPGAEKAPSGAPPPPPTVYKCVLSSCVKTGPENGTAYKSSTCDGACGPPTLTSLASLRMQTLAVGVVQPTGWLGRQLATQVNGLSGHLQRFWPDVMNSSWIHPENGWNETQSDRGGNMPYWLNGVIPMVMQTRSLSDRVDSTGYNLTHTVVDYVRRLVATQKKQKAAGQTSIWDNFNLGTWNVVRSSILLMSAVPAETPLLLPFVLSYIQAAHQRLKNEGWVSVITLCRPSSTSFGFGSIEDTDGLHRPPPPPPHDRASEVPPSVSSRVASKLPHLR